jgi:hypothetical protein
VSESTPSWFPQISDTHPIQEPRSLGEAAEAVFRSQDLMARQEAEADKQRRRSHALNLADIQDEAEMRAFMGQSTPSAIEYYLMASEAADRAEEAERKHSEARRIEAQDRRIAELEEQVAAAEVERGRSLRSLSQANQAAAAFRRQAE